MKSYWSILRLAWSDFKLQKALIKTDSCNCKKDYQCNICKLKINMGVTNGTQTANKDY